MKFKIETSWQLGMEAHTLYYFEARDPFNGEWVKVGTFATEVAARKEAHHLNLARNPPKPIVKEFEL